MNRKLGVQIITFLTIFLFVFSALPIKVQSAPPITQETIIVDITGNGDFTSIKDAINSADVTDIVYIRKGTYTEHGLGVNKKIAHMPPKKMNPIRMVRRRPIRSPNLPSGAEVRAAAKVNTR